MPRVAALVLALVVVCSAPAAAATATEDVPVPGGSAALSRLLGIDPPPDRGRFIYEITRLIYDNPEGHRPEADRYIQWLRQPPGRKREVRPAPDRAATDSIPVPLTADAWGDAIFHRRVAREELVSAIVADRSASLLCHGLAPLDDQTLQYFADHPALLSRIYDRSAPAFAAFSSSLRVRANRVVPPADRDDVVAMWEAVVGEKVTRADRFIQQLLEMNDGRVVGLYDTIGQLDVPHRAFVLGFWIPDAAVRLDRFKTLITAGTSAYREWHVRTMPFNRSSFDLTMTLGRIEVADNGTPAAPNSRGFWTRVFSGVDVPEDAARQLRGVDDEPLDAAWLADTIGSADVRQRAERLEQMAIGQRVFGNVANGRDRADVFVALRAISRYRLLILTLDRIGIRSPSVFAAAVRHAMRLSPVDGRRGFVAQAQFQGALAIVSRMARVRTFSVPQAQALIEKLVALPFGDDGRYGGAVAGWLRNSVAAALPLGDTIESAILLGMSGPAAAAERVPRLAWEGQPYRLDLGAAERRRLQQVRDRQEGLPLDVALDIGALGHTLASDALSPDELPRIVTRLSRMIDDTPQRPNRAETENVPPGVSQPSNVHETLQKVVEELSKAIRTKDAKRAARESELLGDLADQLLSEVLLSISYAADVGDPEGTVLLAADVSHRHDFGFGAKDSELRLRQVWSMPRQDVTPGIPWRVSGSLLGLDIALAPLTLRRLNFERVLEAPKLTTNQRDTFALSVAQLNPYDLRDADRDRIAEAIDRGARRVAELSGAQALDALADEIAMEPWRRRAIAWTFTHERDRVASMLSLTELLVLGGGRPAELDAWGMTAVATGCVCPRLPRPGSWPSLIGRPQLGLIAVGVADLNLHVAVMLKEMQLPAALARVILSGAMQDFIDEVRPTDDGDWLTLVRRARLVPRDRVEDYIAAATATGPLVPDSEQH